MNVKKVGVLLKEDFRLRNSTKEERSTLREIFVNLLEGNITLTEEELRKLKRKKKIIRRMSDTGRGNTKDLEKILKILKNPLKKKIEESTQR